MQAEMIIRSFGERAFRVVRQGNGQRSVFFRLFYDGEHVRGLSALADPDDKRFSVIRGAAVFGQRAASGEPDRIRRENFRQIFQKNEGVIARAARRADQMRDPAPLHLCGHFAPLRAVFLRILKNRAVFVEFFPHQSIPIVHRTVLTFCKNA